MENPNIWLRQYFVLVAALFGAPITLNESFKSQKAFLMNIDYALQ